MGEVHNEQSGLVCIGLRNRQSIGIPNLQPRMGRNMLAPDVSLGYRRKMTESRRDGTT